MAYLSWTKDTLIKCDLQYFGVIKHTVHPNYVGASEALIGTRGYIRQLG